MPVWRLLDLQTCDAFANMAIDEAVLHAVAEDKASNTVRFYRWSPSAVSIGRFQHITDEINIENCLREGVSVVRRISGGGAVYHDSEGEVTYSVIANKKDLGTLDVAALYTRICEGLINAMTLLSVKADFNPGNYKQCPNITVNGKKVSGSAQYHRGNVILQHGTLLLDTDVAKMFMFLQVKDAKTAAQAVCTAKNKITSLRELLGKQVNTAQAQAALREGFEKALGIRLEEACLTNLEEAQTEKLRRQKYATNQWNFEGKADTVLTV